MTMPVINLPELDHAPVHGMIMRGWDFSQAEVQAALQDGRILNPAVELCSNVCPWSCDFCFTEATLVGKKRRLANELSLTERIRLLEELADHGARSINIVGAGEPTIDPFFWDLLAACNRLGMVPLVYTEGALKLAEMDFCKRLYDMGATVVLKVNSLFQEDYQNKILVSGNVTPHTPKFNYFRQRQKALDNLIALGFNRDSPTRLAFDTILCRENEGEIDAMHRFTRDNNIFTLLVNFLPSGRSESGHTNALSRDEQFAIFARLARIDRREYGITQSGRFPYGGSQPCLIRGTGAFIKIGGDVLACPGETRAVGNIRRESLSDIWNRLVDVRRAFDGGCPPRERFWKALQAEMPAEPITMRLLQRA